MYNLGDERTGRLDEAAERHPDGLHDQYLTVQRANHTLHLLGEIDMTNLDVLATALKAVTHDHNHTVHIDLSHTRFLSAAAVAALAHETATFRAAGGLVEIHNPTSHVARVLRLLWRRPLPGLQLT
jgi:anti-anti-sigma factor